MDIDTLQYVVGEVKADTPATIRFFGRITETSTNRFNEEFDFLENVIHPSCIRILINSEGGSVLYGMSTYSTIANARVDTECIIEGVAASMASIIWAAGRRSLMRDYAILMIHNPMLPSEEEDNEASDMLRAFTRQIETIYRKRFGLKAEHIRSIMEGEAGKDGTFFDARSAVQAGIIPPENIIHTSKQLCEKVHDEISVLTDTAAMQKLMCRISAENKLFDSSVPTLCQMDNNMTEEKTQGFEYGAIAASLGMKDREVKDVMTRISELAALEPKYKDLQKSLSDAQTVIAGREATIQNLQKELAAATSKLTAFEQKEKDELEARIDAMVAQAVEEGKIDAEAKTQWIEMARSNLSLAESTLASIPARERISKEIASDPDSVKAAAEAAKSAGELMAEKVNEIVGSEFKFKKIQ